MKNIITIIAVLLLLNGCKKDLLDTAPTDQLASSTMWTTDNLTDLGVNGVYAALRLGQNTGGASYLEPYQLDRLGMTGTNRAADNFMMGTITPSDGFFSSNWQNFYEGIQRANTAIKNIANVSPSVSTKKLRLIAECKFLRAYFYTKLNQGWRGVPVYLDPFGIADATKPRASEDSVWGVIIKDLTDCINETNLPLKYAKGDANYGRVTKGAAYALRGKAFLYQQKWALAASDFAQVQAAGFSLFNDYKLLFKEANEQCSEMIFSIQNISVLGLGSTIDFLCGTRSSFGSCWNSFYVSPVVAELYENNDGSKFSWENIIPGYTSMTPLARQVYFLRDGLTASEISAAVSRGADMTKYLTVGNEARIKQAYANRDPRLGLNVITPYATYNGVVGAANVTSTYRFPYRTSALPTADLQTDATTFYFYLYRKFVDENSNESLSRNYGPVDFPLIRYADVLLMWAEAINEQAFSQSAIDLVNLVRTRVGMPVLQSTDPTKPTYVSNQVDLRERIRNERRVEFVNEGVDYYDEIRWKTWKDKVFFPGSGSAQIWGQNAYAYNWAGDYIYLWPVPQVEIARNPNLVQNPGWPN